MPPLLHPSEPCRTTYPNALYKIILGRSFILWPKVAEESGRGETSRNHGTTDLGCAGLELADFAGPGSVERGSGHPVQPLHRAAPRHPGHLSRVLGASSLLAPLALAWPGYLKSLLSLLSFRFIVLRVSSHRLCTPRITFHMSFITLRQFEIIIPPKTTG
jgi:hypothetical protein